MISESHVVPDIRTEFRRRAILVLFAMILTWSPQLRADETHSRYFNQLRQRGLFSLAETEAISRLADDQLSPESRAGFTIELSKTLAQHAGFVADEQRDELWQRAKAAVTDLLDKDPSNQRSILLKGQQASVFVAEGEWLRAEREILPFDERILSRARSACTTAIEQLQSIEKSLSDPARNSPAKKTGSAGPLGHELRTLLHEVRWQLGQSYRNLAELAPANDVERNGNISNAEQSLRKLIGIADEPLQSRARILLATCARLKGNPVRAAEMLADFDKAEPASTDPFVEEFVAERVRVSLERQLPTEAAELILKTRSKRQRLSGELWLLQTRALIALREIAVSKQQQALGVQLAEQIDTTISRCEEQVGGFWSRRCRQLWDNAQTAVKYGPELDALMQRARMEFTAGRIDASLASYATAEKSAAVQGRADLATELGLTRASILLDRKQFEPASTEFLRLSTADSSQERAAKSHLLGVYCLGRMYDEKRSRQRREAYSESLDQHLARYSHDPTFNEALFLKAQFEEQRLQATQALPLYLRIDRNHAKAADAITGAARCYETILGRMSERHLAKGDLEIDAIDGLSKYLIAAGDSIDAWTVTHAEVALRLAAILLMESSDGDNSIVQGDSGSGPKSGDPRGNRVKPVNLDRCNRAEQWLGKVTLFADKRALDPEMAESNKLLRQRIVPLRIVALAGSGNYSEAERALNSLSTSHVQLLAVVERLTRTIAATNLSERTRLASLQRAAAERLISVRDQLTAGERERLDLCLIRANIGAGEFAKAVEVVRRMADASAKDIEKQQELATLLAGVNNPELLVLRKQCWRRIESLVKSGSAEWLTARLEVLRACLGLGQLEEGRKLMQITRVLYPDLGGDVLKARFEAIEKELR